MKQGRFADIRGVREELGKSQSELAKVLGLSIRAIQSYEQGWRNVPQHVQRQAALLCYLKRRRTGKDLRPCWEVRGCSEERRRGCPAHEFSAGELCWFLPGCARCQDLPGGERTVALCESCEVMRAWLP